MGLPGNPTNVARVQELRDDFDTPRRHRRLNQVNAKATKAISALPAPTDRPVIRLHLGTPATRLLELRKRTVMQYAQQAFRHGASGGTRFKVHFAERRQRSDTQLTSAGTKTSIEVHIRDGARTSICIRFACPQTGASVLSAKVLHCSVA